MHIYIHTLHDEELAFHDTPPARDEFHVYDNNDVGAPVLAAIVRRADEGFRVAFQAAEYDSADTNGYAYAAAAAGVLAILLDEDIQDLCTGLGNMLDVLDVQISWHNVPPK